MNELDTEVATLDALNAQLAVGAISPLDHRLEREKTLAQALRVIAGRFGVTLEEPLQVDSNGEFSLVSVKPGRNPHWYGAESFNGFADVLSDFGPRMGAAPLPAGCRLLPENGWCRLNHFSAEKMVRHYHATMALNDKQEPTPGM